MWTDKTKTGVAYRERYKDPLTDKWKKVSVSFPNDTAKNRKSAAVILQDKINKILNTKREEITLSELGEKYLAKQKKTLKASTWRRNSFAVKNICKILGSDILVSRLSSAYIGDKLEELEESPTTTNERLKRLKALLRWGYENDYIENVDYLQKLKPLPDQEKQERITNKYLEQEELTAVCSTLDEYYSLVTQFLALSGLRIGEAIALLKTDVDLKKRNISVTKTYDTTNQVTTSTKTKDSTRDIFIQDELLPICAKLSKMNLERCFRSRKQTELFLCSGYGERLSYAKYSYAFRTAAKELTGKALSVHSLRHTHCSLLAGRLVPIEVISRRLGHSSSQVTKSVYMHVTKMLKDADRDTLEKIALLR